MNTSFRGILSTGVGATLTAGALAIVLLGTVPASAEPGTFWNLLGIPQGSQKLRDARLNRLGNNPDRERVPPLKRIADPANLESKNPAMAAAAKIKKDQDLAPQKIKAIKYLGTIACCCPTNKDDTKNALLAALSDCTAEVRQAAATAICHAAGNPCTICNECSCCTADVMNKLNELATEQDEQGCWKEPNPAVRQAAALALEACRQVRGPEPAPVASPAKEQEDKERRVPSPPKDPGYSTPPAKTAPSKTSKPANNAAESPATENDGWKVRPASAEMTAAGFAYVADSSGKSAVKSNSTDESRSEQASKRPIGQPESQPSRTDREVAKRSHAATKPVVAEQKQAAISAPRLLAAESKSAESEDSKVKLVVTVSEEN